MKLFVCEKCGTPTRATVSGLCHACLDAFCRRESVSPEEFATALWDTVLVDGKDTHPRVICENIRKDKLIKLKEAIKRGTI